MDKKCKIKKCDNKVLAKGFCSYHYCKNKEEKNPIKCKHDGCDRGVFCKEYCIRHYQQFNKYGKTFKTKYDDNEYIQNKENVYMLIKGNKIFIDKEDVEKCKEYKWYIQDIDSDYQRVCARRNGATTKLHRFLLDVESPKIEVDHINGNTFDNRKNNLRICEHSENMKNQKLNTNNTSGYKGVWFNKKTNKWIAEISCDGQKFYLGSYDNKKDAIKIRKEKEKELFGDFRRKEKHL